MPDPIETNTEVAADETPAAPKADAPIILPDDHPLVKTLAAQKETLRELREKSKRLDEIDEANKTELQKAVERAEAAEKAAEVAESARLRASIAAKHGVPEALLTGSTEEQLEAAASALLSFKGTTPSAPSSDGQGKTGDPVSNSVKQLTREDIKSFTAEQIDAAEKAGQLDTLLGRA